MKQQTIILCTLIICGTALAVTGHGDLVWLPVAAFILMVM